MELPDVSKAPVFQIDTNAAAVQAEVISLRSQLVAYVAGLKAQYGSNLNIQIFDTYTLFNNVLANPSAYGVTNTTQSCLNITSDSSLNYFESHSLRSGCTGSTVGGYMFWDLLHPTTHTHQVLGNAVTAFVTANFPSVP
jgi:thermolabile hemolysin